MERELSQSYLKNKHNIYKYRETHKITKEQNVRYCLNWRTRNRETLNEATKLRQRKYDAWKRASKIYLNILLF